MWVQHRHTGATTPTLATVHKSHITWIREVGNRHNPYAIAVKKDEIVIRHPPHKISCICSIFIRQGGKIYCTVTNSRRYSADLAQGGMEIPCTLTFKITNKHESEKAH